MLPSLSRCARSAGRGSQCDSAGGQEWRQERSAARSIARNISMQHAASKLTAGEIPTCRATQVCALTLAEHLPNQGQIATARTLLPGMSSVDLDVVVQLRAPRTCSSCEGRHAAVSVGALAPLFAPVYLCAQSCAHKPAHASADACRKARTCIHACLHVHVCAHSDSLARRVA